MTKLDELEVYKLLRSYYETQLLTHKRYRANPYHPIWARLAYEHRLILKALTKHGIG